jgi:hypothetical protein
MGKAVAKRTGLTGGEVSVSIGTGRGPAEPDPDEPERPGKKWTLAISAVIGVFALLSAYALISGVSGSNGSSRASGTPAATHTPIASASTVSSPSVAGSPPTAAPPAASTPISPQSPAQHPLAVAAIAAFGPDGTSDGDNPDIASRVVDGGETQPWYSSWYASPAFGNLQSGTGLLLDMGRPVTVSSVQLVVGNRAGTAVQVRVGDTATLAGLSTVAKATDVSGTVRLSTTSEGSARYVLIWFTTLPPNGQGKYQVSVYEATVEGTAGI